MTDPSLETKIRKARIVAVLVVDDADDAIPLAQALSDGGVSAIELTLRTPAALDAIRSIRDNFPQMLLGAGTVLTPEQASQAKQAGADFAVSPGLNPRVVDHAQEIDLPFYPGVMTPSEIEKALEMDCRLLKFFPAEPCGGIKAISTIAAPYRHLGISFIPLGGLGLSNLADYLSSDLIAAVGGSWLAKRDDISRKNWKSIQENARAAMDAANSIDQSQ